MNRPRFALATLVIALAGCSTAPRAGAIPALCDARCFIPCVDGRGDTGVRWESAADDPAAFDALGESVIPALSDKLRGCELHRQACNQCLRRLHNAGVVDLGEGAHE